MKACIVLKLLIWGCNLGWSLLTESKRLFLIRSHVFSVQQVKWRESDPRSERLVPRGISLPSPPLSGHHEHAEVKRP